MRLCILPVVAAALLMAGVAVGDPPTPTTHYRWKDATGVVHFSDTIPASALAGGYDIVNNQGMVVRHVARTLTPAERRAAAATAAKAAAAKRIARQQGVEDAQLLAAYPTDKALEASQQAQLGQLENEIATLQTNLRSQEDSLTELLGHAADLEHAKKPIPPYLHKRIADQRQTINAERSALAQRHDDLANTKAKFAAQLERYRTLRTKFGSSGDPPQQ
ncbi:MAG: DUF4124 domain-containing protein [Rhodanobacteraceae bacterium]